MKNAVLTLPLFLCIACGGGVQNEEKPVSSIDAGVIQSDARTAEFVQAKALTSANLDLYGYGFDNAVTANVKKEVFYTFADNQKDFVTTTELTVMITDGWIVDLSKWKTWAYRPFNIFVIVQNQATGELLELDLFSRNCDSAKLYGMPDKIQKQRVIDYALFAECDNAAVYYKTELKHDTALVTLRSVYHYPDTQTVDNSQPEMITELVLDHNGRVINARVEYDGKNGEYFYTE